MMRSQSALSSLKLPAFALAVLSLFSAMPPAAHADSGSPVGAVYTMTNSTAGNAVLVFARATDGTLTPVGAVATGGTGSGGGLGNQGGIVLDRNGHRLFAVNAGSNELSAFAVDSAGLSLADKIATGGVLPISVSVHRDLVYVLHAGSDSLSGLRVDRHGRLSPIAGSLRPLSGIGVGPAQVEFSPDGRHLVVTEKATNRILVYPVGDDGLLGLPAIQASPTPTPFGFAFGKRDQFFVSEAAGGLADLSAVSSYQLEGNGTARLIDPSVPDTETAACWIVVTGDGRFVYTSNTGSGTLSGYAVDAHGGLTLLDVDGRTADTGAGSAPIDMALARNSRYLYSLNSGNGTISAFRVDPRGALAPVATLHGLPASANGLAAH
jgi:6-phosphogluconolactonase (cycloisomerase 2 family)